MEFLSILVYLLYIGMIAIAKGFGDAAFGNKELHTGAYNDTWHKVTRWLYYIPAHVMPPLIALLVYFFPPTSIWILLPLIITPFISFMGMRRGVDIAGKDEIWFGEEFNWSTGIKAFFRKVKKIV